MTAARRVVIACDALNRWGRPCSRTLTALDDVTIAEARRNAAARGWVHRGGRDVCDDHDDHEEDR